MSAKEQGKASPGIPTNVAGLLSYMFGWVSGLVFYLIEKDNKTVRFHAMQSMVVFGAAFLAQMALLTLMAICTMTPLKLINPLFSVLSTLLSLTTVVFWIVLMVKTYQGEKFKVPYLGDIAEKWAQK